MEADLQAAVNLGLEKYARCSNKRMDYGTAGFRDKASELPHVMYRMGLLAVLRSKAKQSATIGLMITASHNPEEDNGVKLCNPQGDMLDRDWEVLATDLANANNEDLKQSLLYILNTIKINYEIPANVYLARDTRISSPSLANAAMDGIKVLSGQITDFGLLTTPQLHYVVCCKNNGLYGIPTPEGYYGKLSKAFEKLRSEKVQLTTNYKSSVSVDGANGVGAPKLKELVPYLTSLKIDIFNDGKTGVLNHLCGADFVKVQQKPPEGTVIISGQRYASFDGDADRLIYFYLDDQNTFHMLDGDKIASLVARYINELVKATGLNIQVRVVQTAYANGSSTRYIESELNIPVTCVPTGVKYLHHEAKQHDIGIYFEANGHGTVVFSEKVKCQIQALAGNKQALNEQRNMAKCLMDTIDLINETVGDAISDLLLVEAILCYQGWNIADWDSLYTDLPNRQLKVIVPNRKAVTTTNAERTCVTPKLLQNSIDSAVLKYKNARAFVRPSGTEDIIRVYAEADTQDHADLLAQEISLAVQKLTALN